MYAWQREWAIMVDEQDPNMIGPHSIDASVRLAPFHLNRLNAVVSFLDSFYPPKC